MTKVKCYVSVQVTYLLDISYSLIYSLSSIDKREWVNIHRKRTKLLA